MLSENQNRHEWQGKLNDLTSLPGGIFDKAEAWDILHQRLSAKKKKNGAGAYWLAAAIAASFLIFFLFDSGKEPLVKRDYPTTKTVAKKTGVIEELTKQEDAAQHLVNQSTVSQAKTTVRSKQVATNLKQNELLVAADTAINIVAIPPENITPAKDSIVESIAMKPTKHKLRVMHINELNLPQENRDHFVRIEKRSGKMLSGGNFSTSVLGNYTDNDIIKIKLSSNN